MRSRQIRAYSITVCLALTASLAACSSDEPAKTKTTASTCPPSNPAPSREVSWTSIYANVYNASDNNGEARRIAQRLQWRGLNTLDVSNDPQSQEREAPKYAEIRYGAMGRTIALNLAQQIPHANLYLDEDRSNPTVDIVIGNKFELKPQPPRPIKDVGKVQVYNTTFYGGLAGIVSGQLAKQGFKTSAESNDKAYYPNDTAVVVYDEEGKPDAERVALSLHGARLLQDTQAHTDVKGRDVRVYLGSKWPDSGKVIPLASATPKPSATKTSRCS